MIAPLLVLLWLADAAAATVPDTQTNEKPAAPAYRGVCPYSAEALKEGVEGTVRIRLLVTAFGSVRTTYVMNSSGNDALDDSARACTKKWRFKPALLRGKPVDAWVAFDIIFRMHPDSTQKAPSPDAGSAESRPK